MQLILGLSITRDLFSRFFFSVIVLKELKKD